MGWQALATTNAEDVARLFRGRHKFNIGIATGRRSGCFVLDIDCKAIDGRETLAKLEAQHGALPKTWSVGTPSGGAHLYFANPLDRSVGNRASFAAALDIRGEGGFVVAPPSTVDGASYRWLKHPTHHALAEAPQWLLELAAPQRPPPHLPALPLQLHSLDRTARYVCSAINGECSDLASMARDSGRNQRLFIASARLGELIGAGLLRKEIAEAALERAAADCSLLAEDGVSAIRATIASGIRRGVQNQRAGLA